MQVDIRLDVSRVASMLGALEREKSVATSRALNKTVSRVRTEALVRLRPDYPSIKVGTLRARIKLLQASAKKLQAQAVFTGARIPLHGNFGMRVLKSGALRFGKLPWKVEDHEGKPVSGEMLDRAFRNRLRIGGRATVLSRQGKTRYPIGVLVAPALSRVIVEKKLGDAMKAFGKDQFLKLLEHEMKFVISRRPNG